MNPLGILVDANVLGCGLRHNKNRRGIYFAAYNLIDELINRKDVTLYFFINKSSDNKVKNFITSEWPDYNCIFFEYRPLVFFNLYNKFRNIKIISNLLSKFLDFQKKNQVYYRNRFFDEHHCNIFLSPNPKIPGIISSCELKKFTVVYDMLPIVKKEFFVKGAIVSFQKLVESFNKNDYYFTISDYTKTDLLKVVPSVDPNHVFTSYISCSDDISYVIPSDSIKKKYRIPLDKKYIFSLFAVEKRKNLERNIRAFLAFISKHNLNDIVYVVGGAKFESLPPFFDEIDSSKIVFTGYIDDCDLSYLYSGAEFFVFTSLYEGFGLPVLEAMRCGCPVVVSDSTSLPEVVGDAGIQIDCESVEQHMAAYEKYYFDRKFREESIKKGFSQAKKFSWEKTVDFMIKRMLETI